MYICACAERQEKLSGISHCVSKERALYVLVKREGEREAL